MELIEYRKDYLENIKMLAAAESEGTVSTFTKTMLTDMEELNLITDFELCFATGKYGRKKFRVDGYSFDEYDNSMSIFITDYDGNEKINILTKTEASTLFERINTFLVGTLHGSIRYDIEISTPVYDLIEEIINLEGTIRKYRFFIITDKVISDKISSLNQGKIDNVTIEYNIWDIQRLYRIINAGDVNEHVKIDFTSITGNGLPCLKVGDISTTDIECYLCVMSGSLLADLYDKYGSRLLEGNVRSFLSNRGKVNKSIRNTILESNGEEKGMFFSYNNGISATATAVSVEEKDGTKVITSIDDLQIVNGGQTTASLSNARYKDKADLSGIFVQMKLTVIPDHEKAQQLIPKIARASNNQNKVSEADFFSNHEFNIRFEQFSRKIYAPAVNGLQYETHWFFERSRGQYDQEQSKMTRAEKKKYLMQNPKNQKITKTDVAKYQNTWMEHPYQVSLGAQKNFAKFSSFIVDEWNKKEDAQFNEEYFKNTIVIAIMFKCIDKIIPKQEWYDKGYKANIVTYTLSLFHYLIRTQFPGYTLNMQYIWDKQKVPDIIYDEFVSMTKFVFNHIISEDRPIKNVTEWCKKEQCWTILKNKNYILNKKIKPLLLKTEELKKGKMSDGKNEAKINVNQVQNKVVSKGSNYWKKVLRWGRQNKLLTPKEASFLSIAANMKQGKLPSNKQCQHIVNIEDKLIDKGFIGK